MKLKSIRDIFQALNEAGIKYLLAGGLAVVAHGYVRFTADIDIILGMGKKNLINAMQVFETLGYKPRAPVKLNDFVSAEKRTEWIDKKGLTVFSLWNPDEPATEIDIFVKLPVNFEAAYAMGEDFNLFDNVTVKTLGLEDLLVLKKQAGRPKDLDDIEKLILINKEDNHD